MACGHFIKSRLILSVWKKWFSLTAYFRAFSLQIQLTQNKLFRHGKYSQLDTDHWAPSPEYGIFLDFDLTDGVLIQALQKQREIILYLDPLRWIQAVPADRKHSRLKVKTGRLERMCIMRLTMDIYLTFKQPSFRLADSELALNSSSRSFKV